MNCLASNPPDFFYHFLGYENNKPKMDGTGCKRFFFSNVFSLVFLIFFIVMRNMDLVVAKCICVYQQSMLREIKFFIVLLFVLCFFFFNTVVFSHHFIHSAPEWWLDLWQNSGISQNIKVLLYNAENIHVGNQYLELLFSFHPCYIPFKNVCQWNQL